MQKKITRSVSKITGSFQFCLLVYAIVISAVTLIQNFEVILQNKAYGVFLFSACILVIAAVVAFFSQRFPDKLHVFFIAAISLVTRLLFVFSVKTPVSSDFLLIYNAAQDVISGDFSWLRNPFFAVWRYQIPFVYYEAVILKLFGTEQALRIINVFFMTGTNLLIYFIAKRIASPRAALICALLYSVYPAPILLSSVLTNQHISLFFFMLGIYFLLQNSRLYYKAASGFFLFMGNLMRPEGAVIILSIVLYLFITMKPDKKRFIGILKQTSLLLITFLVMIHLTDSFFRITGATPQGITNAFPEWKFVLGLDSEAKGVYNEKNAHIISISDPEQRKQEALRVISALLQANKNLPGFFYEKSKLMWANFELSSWSLSHIENERPLFGSSTTFTYGKLIKFILEFEKCEYLMLLTAVVFSCLLLLIGKISRKKHVSGMCFLFVCLYSLNYTIYLFIEIQVRYRYFIMPFIFILSAVAIQYTVKQLDQSFKKIGFLKHCAS